MYQFAQKIQQNDDLKTRLDIRNKVIKILENDKKELVENVENLTLVSYKLTQGKDNLDKILGNQRYSLSKNGLEFGLNNLQKNSKITFVKASHTSYLCCNYCNNFGHIASMCNLRKNARIKQIWVPKGTILTNMTRPNHIGFKCQKSH